ncbi:hypothetical protein Moror_5063 [Moniliophthora roreri MCA 2997]|uniref:Uncharacterized protein n=1 Tax=Moniliophthora roreri (strain MCA 2997) TaxID=1381753 RepID=V2Y3U4_MONRO|nr:hypothetical protein Moror_5063 [Moniliophthora roreri MCA 2997]
MDPTHAKTAIHRRNREHRSARPLCSATVLWELDYYQSEVQSLNSEDMGRAAGGGCRKTARNASEIMAHSLYTSIQTTHNFTPQATDIHSISRLCVQLYDDSLGANLWSPQIAVISGATRKAPSFVFIHSCHLITILDPFLSKEMVDLDVGKIPGSMVASHNLCFVRYPSSLDTFLDALWKYHPQLISITEQVIKDSTSKKKRKIATSHQMDGGEGEGESDEPTDSGSEDGEGGTFKCTKKARKG